MKKDKCCMKFITNREKNRWELAFCQQTNELGHGVQDFFRLLKMRWMTAVFDQTRFSRMDMPFDGLDLFCGAILIVRSLDGKHGHLNPA